MVRLAVVLVLLASAAAAQSQTTTVCPWVTTGTAERLMGGEVSTLVHADGNTAGSCRFSRQRGNTAASIEILVGPADAHLCPQESTSLKALGNEAVQCRISSSPSQVSDRIAGRIRKVFFVVTMTNIPDATQPEPADPHLADAYAASAIERLAEQVVGNLY